MDRVIYLKSVLEQIPRLLGLLDRNPASRTYGCFDRSYWHYNFVDFACARHQEAVLTLACLWKTEHELNPYSKDTMIQEWVNAGLMFWGNIQKKDGSFDEWYPNEHSFVATAFSSYAISETLLILGENVRDREFIVSALEKAAVFLMQHDEERAQNQEAGAALALYNIYLLTKKEKYRDASDKKINIMLKKQTSEGWWYEYNGADIGYLSLAIDYLAKYYEKTKDAEVSKALERAVKFISYFIHPNFSFGGEYGSRNTEYLIPSGFEILSGNEASHKVAKAIRISISRKCSVVPSSLDDRYLCYILYNWLQAFERAVPIDNAVRMIFEDTFIKRFEIAGLYITSTPHFYLIINVMKGGSFKLFFKENSNVVYDSGVLVSTETEDLSSSQLSTKNKAVVSERGISVNGFLSVGQRDLLTPFKNILMRQCQISLGRSGNLMGMLKEKLRDKLITDGRFTDKEFSREFIIDDDHIRVIDEVKGIPQIKKILLSAKYSNVYTPSSRYFQVSDLKSPTIILDNPKGHRILRKCFSSGVEYEVLH